jgi:hypothetical protein
MNMTKKTSTPGESELTKHRKRALQRLAKYAVEGDWEGMRKEVRNMQLTAEEEKEVDRQAGDIFHRLACEQARDATGQATLERLFRVAYLYGQLNPQDGIDAALARVIPTLTETTMECFRRASVVEALPVRDLELNHAKLALVLSALTRAWDNHRQQGCSRKKGVIGGGGNRHGLS